MIPFKRVKLSASNGLNVSSGLHEEFPIKIKLRITSKTLTTFCFLTVSRPGCSKPRRGGLVRNLKSDAKASFCQQVDDWMLLKITEKIIQRNVFAQKKKKSGLTADRPSNNCSM